MRYLSTIGSRMWDCLKNYPITIAIRGTVIIFLFGLAVKSSSAAAVEALVATLSISSYLIKKTIEFFGGGIGPASSKLLFPYSVFEVIWYVLSWPSEVPDRES